MFVSSGWFLLVGSTLGAMGVACAKKFYRSDFANSDGVIDQEDYKTEVKIAPLKRWLIVAACAVIAFVGILLIEHDNNWNPFQSSIEATRMTDLSVTTSPSSFKRI